MEKIEIVCHIYTMKKKYDSLNHNLLVSFGKHLRELRIEKGLTQEKLTEISGFTRSYYTEIETGKRNTALINLNKLAIALDITLSELMDFDIIEED